LGRRRGTVGQGGDRRLRRERATVETAAYEKEKRDGRERGEIEGGVSSGREKPRGRRRGPG
jgi:hypothetical protein